jgi:hypothetical protein
LLFGAVRPDLEYLQLFDRTVFARRRQLRSGDGVLLARVHFWALLGFDLHVGCRELHDRRGVL